jgi:predicted nucleic acid-binding Zn ribbon protein
VKRPSKKPSDIATVLQGLFENSKSPLSPGFQRWKLESNWALVVGEDIAKHTRPVDYQNRVLIVEVTSSVWLHELRYRVDEIRLKVNHYMNEPWALYVKLIHK